MLPGIPTVSVMDAYWCMGWPMPLLIVMGRASIIKCNSPQTAIGLPIKFRLDIGIDDLGDVLQRELMSTHIDVSVISCPACGYADESAMGRP